VSRSGWSNRRLAGVLVGVLGVLYAASVVIILVRN
jgi:hypothetical protein